MGLELVGGGVDNCECLCGVAWALFCGGGVDFQNMDIFVQEAVHCFMEHKKNKKIVMDISRMDIQIIRDM